MIVRESVKETGRGRVRVDEMLIAAGAIAARSGWGPVSGLDRERKELYT